MMLMFKAKMKHTVIAENEAEAINRLYDRLNGIFYNFDKKMIRVNKPKPTGKKEYTVTWRFLDAKIPAIKKPRKYKVTVKQLKGSNWSEKIA